MHTLITPRSRYDDHSTMQDATVCHNLEPSVTQQQFCQDADINTILKKYESSGIVPSGQSQGGQYGDYSEIPNYHSYLNLTIQAQNSFNSLSPQIRSKFQNDPQQLINFLSLPQNQSEAISLGLIPPLPQQLSDNVPIIEKTTSVVISTP